MKFNILSKHNMVNKKRLQPLSICASAILACIVNYSAMADQTINDDLVVKGSICVGFDCSTGETFGYDTIRMKENNLRIKFQDTSASSSFPTRDWQITVNDSVNGGANYFRIENMDAETVPFTILDGADSNSLYIHTGKRIGIGTSAPQMQLHAVTGNSPTIRLEQDQSGGFAAQAWDLSSNETNFFLRDITNGGTLPLRISTGAPNASIFVAGDGDVGFETTTPDGLFDIAHPTDQNNHALLVSPLGYLGVNIDNSFVPRGLFDVQTTGGVSRFLVQTDGKVGIGMGTSDTPAGVFETKISGTSKFLIDNDGNVGVGGTVTSNSNRLEVKSSDATKSLFHVTNDGKVGIGTGSISSYYGAIPNFEVYGATNGPALVGVGTQTTTKVGSLMFSANGVDKWSLSSRHNFESGATVDRIGFFNATAQELLTVHQNGNIYIGNGPNFNATSHALESSTGAYLTTSGVWTSASSRDYKKNIKEITFSEAVDTLLALAPVTFNYITEPEETYAGFIAEDVPDLVATSDHKGLAPMDIVAILTKVLKEQHVLVNKQQKDIEDLLDRLASLEEEK